MYMYDVFNLSPFPVHSKRVFILGPSHHVYLSGCALSPTTHYETPLYNLTIDQAGEAVTQCRNGGKWVIPLLIVELH